MKRGNMKYWWKIVEVNTNLKEIIESRFKTHALNLQTAIRAIHFSAKSRICHKGEWPCPVSKMIITQDGDFFVVDFGSKFFHAVVWNRYA